MVDELFDRTYQNGREQLNRDLGLQFDRLGRALLNAFKVLNRLEYSAPWSKRNSPSA